MFDEWWSNDEIDKMFGAKGNFLKQNCVGRNIFVDLSTVIGNGNLGSKIFDKIKRDVTTPAPTRFLLAVPRSDPDGLKFFAGKVFRGCAN